MFQVRFLSFFALFLTIARIRCDYDDFGDEMYDLFNYPDFGPRPCKSRIVTELAETKELLRNLQNMMEGLRRKIDPAFKVSTTAKPESHCPHGFHYVAETRTCYKVVYELLNRTSADAKCQMLNPEAHLVTITTDDENRVLKNYLTKAFSKHSDKHRCRRFGWPSYETALWTRGQRINKTDCGSTFEWKLENGTGMAFDYTNWHKGEPNCYGDGEGCMQIIPHHDYAWNDVPCDVRVCPLCEIEPK